MDPRAKRDQDARTSRARLRHAAEGLASPMPALMAEAERVANTVAFGIHGRRRVGQGETFWQYRHYQSGDTPGTIDWRKSAREPRDGHLFVRELEWEAAQSVYLYADRSPSMQWASSKNLQTKADVAAVLTLALTLLLARAGERVGNLASPVPAATGRAVFNRMATEIANDAGEDRLPTGRRLRPHARLVLVSDFLAPMEELQPKLDHYTTQGLRGTMLLIADPAEEDFPFEGRLRFEAPGSRDTLTFGRSETLRDDYRRIWEAHRETLKTRALRTGWSFLTHRTDQPLERALMALYLDLAGGNIGKGGRA